ncbi:MFS transporter [Thermogymnomonas acidicola]|uniref:MFS transporter n=2 Tax=Thermogymnomonas acidicola TaxID=399579 RepID=A0AA37BRG7_9ARCH|nr:MFS transporter [Thermogymnomonas acidicola]GGM74584.1 MFS transporter [Thermogymnomonas acidicola]
MEYRGWVLAITSMGTFLAVVNSTSLLVALPTVMISLHTTFFVAVWILLIYSLVLTVLSPFLGREADLVGRKRIYSTGYILFFAGSTIAAVSPDPQVLILGRVVQGSGAACLFSNSLAIITDSFSGPQLGRAMAINSSVMGVGIAVGPLVGGFLSFINWRYVFVFNAPIALAGFVLSSRLLKEVKPVETGVRPDYVGSVTLSAFMTLIVLFLTVGPLEGWAHFTTVLFLLVSLVFLVLFLIMERRVRYPLINFSLFRNRRFTGSIISVLLNSITRFSAIFLLTIYFQGPLGINPLLAGILLMPYAAGLGFVSYMSPHVVKRVNDITVQTLGLAFTGASVAALFISSTGTPYYILAILMLLMGVGIGLYYTPNNSTIMLSVEPGQRGIVAGFRSLIVNMGSVVGMAIVFTIVATYVPESILGSAFLGLSVSLTETQKAAFVTGIDVSFLAAGLICLVAVPVFAVMLRRSSK